MKTHPTCLVAAKRTHSHNGTDCKLQAFILVLVALAGQSFAQVTLSAESQSATPGLRALPSPSHCKMHYNGRDSTIRNTGRRSPTLVSPARTGCKPAPDCCPI